MNLVDYVFRNVIRISLPIVQKKIIEERISKEWCNNGSN